MEGSKLVSVLIDSGKKLSMAEPTVEQKTFSQLQLTEEQVEDFLDGNLDVLFAGDPDAQSMLQVGRQVPNEYNGECDLVALDAKGCIVAIEIKRDPKDCKARVEAFEMQAIRYASSFARISTPEELIEQVYVPYLLKYRKEELAGEDVHEHATKKVTQFLKGNNCQNNFNNKQRIILVASGFDPEAKSACAWLYRNNIDITCIQISPLAHASQTYLLVDRIIPPMALEEMLAKVARRKVRRITSSADDVTSAEKRAKLPTTAEMFEQGAIKTGDLVMIKKQPESTATVIDYRTVDYNGTKMTWNEWAKKITGWSAVNIYANVTIGDKSLDDLRGNTE